MRWRDTEREMRAEYEPTAWKETSVNEQVGKDGGPIETKDVYSGADIERRRGLVSRITRARPLFE
jgi:hypothetical protein